MVSRGVLSILAEGRNLRLLERETRRMFVECGLVDTFALISTTLVGSG